MLTHKELFAKCTENDARRFFSALPDVVSCVPDWMVDDDWIDATADSVGDYVDGLFSIVCKRLGNVSPFGVVLLYDTSRRGVFVSNIVPTIRREPTVAEYNVCFDEFVTSMLKHLFKGLKVVLAGGEIACKDLLSSELWALFKDFNLKANRRVLHSNDEWRWRRFIIRMASSRKRLNERQMRCLLSEFGWPNDMARRMAERSTYELAIVRQSKGL